jgi:hypothetical protein
MSAPWRKGHVNRPVGAAKMFSSGQREKSVGAAGTYGVRDSEKIYGRPRMSAARGRLRNPTKRRKLTRPGRNQPQARSHQVAPRDSRRRDHMTQSNPCMTSVSDLAYGGTITAPLGLWLIRITGIWRNG